MVFVSFVLKNPMRRLSTFRSPKYFLSILALAALSACGGGGDDAASTPELTGSTGTAPGNTGTTPGDTGTTPGNTGTTPGGSTGTSSGSSEVCFNPRLWTAGTSH